MRTALFTQLQLNNLTALTRLREICARDPDDACRTYGVPPDSAGWYASLPRPDAIALAFELDVSLLVPRLAPGALREALLQHEAHPGGFEGTPLQQWNLANLQAVREACRSCAGEAAWAYRLDACAVRRHAGLDDSELLALAATLPVSACVPRYRLRALRLLADKPSRSRGLFAAVMEDDLDTAH